MTVTAKKRLYLAIGLGISAVLLWMLFRNIDVSLLGDALKRADYWWLIPNVLLIIITMYQRAYRWRFMLEPIKVVQFRRLLAATWIGFMANNVLPLRLGEFVRAYSLASQDRDVSKSASLATIFVERMVFDLMALLLIFGAVIGFSSLVVDESMKYGLYTAIGIAIVGLLFILIMALKPEQAGNLLVRYLFFLPAQMKKTIQAVLLRFSEGLTFLTDSKAVFLIAIQTILIWLLMGISNIFVFWAFGFPLGLDASYVLLVVVSISILVPSSPGFVGVYHAGAVWAMMSYGIAKEDALSCALVLHAAQYIVVTVMGFYFLKKEHLSLRKLEVEAEKA